MKKRLVEYKGREYRVYKGGDCDKCVLLDLPCGGNAGCHCGLDDGYLRETFRSRLSHWWRGFVKRHIEDAKPGDDESHAATRYQVTGDPESLESFREVNARRGHEE